MPVTQPLWLQVLEGIHNDGPSAHGADEGAALACVDVKRQIQLRAATAVMAAAAGGQASKKKPLLNCAGRQKGLGKQVVGKIRLDMVPKPLPVRVAESWSTLSVLLHV